MARDELRVVVDKYLPCLEGEVGGTDPTGRRHARPLRNGVRTAKGSSSLERQSWRFDVTDRYLVIDEEAGIVWGMFPISQASTSLVRREPFKVMDGQVWMVQAVMANVPAKAWV